MPDKRIQENISNLLSVIELKELFISKLDAEKRKGLTRDNLRFFCLGKELSDDLFVYSYDLRDEITI